MSAHGDDDSLGGQMYHDAEHAISDSASRIGRSDVETECN